MSSMENSDLLRIFSECITNSEKKKRAAHFRKAEQPGVNELSS